MYDPEDILEAARTIRPYLGDLLETEIADPIDTQLADLLTQTDPPPAIANNILELLTAQVPPVNGHSTFCKTNRSKPGVHY